MKKIIATLLLATATTSAFADEALRNYYGGHHGGYYGHPHGGYYGGYRGYNHYENHYHNSGVDILAPLVIGGVIGYAINESNRQPTIYQQAPQVIYQQAPTVYQKCTAWVETIDQYGVTTRTRTCY